MIKDAHMSMLGCRPFMKHFMHLEKHVLRTTLVWLQMNEHGP